MTNSFDRAIIIAMLIPFRLSVVFLILTCVVSTTADNRIPLYYVKETAGDSNTANKVYPVFDVSPALGTVLVENADGMIWTEGVNVIPDKGGAVIALLEGTAPEAEWAIMGGGAIPYRRSGNYAWFSRAAFKANLEPFFPGDEIVGLIEKHKLYKGGIISPKSESYITVIDDDYIGEICRSKIYDTGNSSRGYDIVSLDILGEYGERLLIIEDTSCQFRVSSYDWLRSGIADFFRYRNGDLHRDGFSISSYEVGLGGLFGGVTSDFYFEADGSLLQTRTAYVEIKIRKERFATDSRPFSFDINGSTIKPKKRKYRDMIEGKTKRELMLYKLPDSSIPPVDIIPPGTPLDLLVYFTADDKSSNDWYLIESKETTGVQTHIGWGSPSDIEISK